MSTDEQASEKYQRACDLAHEIFLPSHALTLEGAAPERLYAALRDKVYSWVDGEWKATGEPA